MKCSALLPELTCISKRDYSGAVHAECTIYLSGQERGERRRVITNYKIIFSLHESGWARLGYMFELASNKKLQL